MSAESVVKAWNDAHEPGIDVIVTDDFGKDHPTKTRSYAELMGGHTPVIWLDGIAGCYDLTRVRVASVVPIAIRTCIFCDEVHDAATFDDDWDINGCPKCERGE